jgi:uncharacterized membrane protein YedE/YeeE
MGTEMKLVKLLKEKSWSPYTVGALIGILSWFAFLTADHPIGITSAFEHTAALIGRSLVPEMVKDYFLAKTLEGKPPKIDWEWMLVVGVFIGSFIGASLSKDRTDEAVPRPWALRFGSTIWIRFIFSFLGGAIMMIGARLAQGCTSGHGISGDLQLAVSSWIFVVIFFSTAILLSLLIYEKKGFDV